MTRTERIIVHRSLSPRDNVSSLEYIWHIMEKFSFPKNIERTSQVINVAPLLDIYEIYANKRDRADSPELPIFHALVSFCSLYLTAVHEIFYLFGPKAVIILKQYAKGASADFRSLLRSLLIHRLRLCQNFTIHSIRWDYDLEFIYLSKLPSGNTALWTKYCTLYLMDYVVLVLIGCFNTNVPLVGPGNPICVSIDLPSDNSWRSSQSTALDVELYIKEYSIFTDLDHRPQTDRLSSQTC